MKNGVKFLLIGVSTFTLISCGGGGGSNSENNNDQSWQPSYSSNLDISSFQEQMYLNNLTFQTMNNILQASNDASNAIIGNIGGGYELEYDYNLYSVEEQNFSTVIPLIIKKSVEANTIGVQGQLDNLDPIKCSNGGDIQMSLTWTNNLCDFNATPINPDFCYKNNKIDFVLKFNNCADQTSITNGETRLSINFPQDPRKSQDGDYIPSNFSYTASNMNIVENQEKYNIENLSLNMDLYMNRIILDMSLSIEKNGKTNIQTKNLRLTYEEPTSGEMYHTIDGFIYGSENPDNSNPQWYKFETVKKFKTKVIGTKKCTVEGKLIVNDSVTIEVTTDNSGNYIYKASDKKGGTDSMPACN